MVTATKGHEETGGMIIKKRYAKILEQEGHNCSRDVDNEDAISLLSFFAHRQILHILPAGQKRRK